MTHPRSEPQPAGATAAPIATDVVGGVAILTIDNPPVNALSRDVRQGLLDAIAAVSHSAETRAVLIVGRNGTFVAGADLREFGRPPTAPQLPEVVAAIETCPLPVVAAIEGAALGGGFELALACDGRVAVEGAVVGLPEGNFGILPGSGGTVRLPRLVDPATALGLVSSCRHVPAREAKALGLVDAVVADPRQEGAAFALGMRRKRRLRDAAPKPVGPEAFEAAARAALKRGRGRPYAREQVEALRRTIEVPFDDALRAERDAFLRLRASDESAALRHLFFAEREAVRVDGLDGVEGLPVRSVGVVGAGTMGSGIAAAFLAAGYAVTMTDIRPETLSSARKRVEGLLRDGSPATSLTLADDVGGLAGQDLIVEAVFEDLEIKKALMERLDRIAAPGAVLATNTSYLDLDAIAAATGRPGSVVGLHFFAPAQVMRLLEVVRGGATTLRVLKTALSLARRLGKVAVVAGVGDGFIGNRTYNAYRAQCEAMLVEGATPEQVDAALEALGFAMGPFAVSDLSGLDIAWANRRRRHAAGADGERDVPVLEWLVGAGRLGRKTGAGWYRYADGRRLADPDVAGLIERARTGRAVAARAIESSEIQARALAAIVNEALLVLEDGVAARASDVDLVLTHGYGFPKHLGGPLFWAGRQPRERLERGLDAVAAGGRRGDLARLGRA